LPRPARIGFDARDVLRKRTGVTGYTRALASELAGRPDMRLIAYVDRFQDPAVGPPAALPLAALDGPPGLWKHLSLPLALLRDRVDLFHSPTGTLPLWSRGKRVVTIHDLFADIEPGWFPRRMGIALRRGQRRAAGTADAVIAVSDTTRRDLLRIYGLPPDRVVVVPNGVDHDRFRPDVEPAETLLGQLGVSLPFVLCVGSLLPWRNAPRLLEAVAMARQSGAPDLQLLFVGRDIWGTDPTAAMAAARGWHWARFAGYVADEQLPGLYAAAAVCAAPSLYEGFGIPPLESMACGTPVVASTAPALQEVLGDAALFVDPRSSAAIADGLARTLGDARLHRQLRTRGLARAAAYHWARAAQETARVYERVLAA
jgi:glycosyltransferase involved in cell wall biosynthesis